MCDFVPLLAVWMFRIVGVVAGCVDVRSGDLRFGAAVLGVVALSLLVEILEVSGS
jgi:hypothetical protein